MVHGRVGEREVDNKTSNFDIDEEVIMLEEGWQHLSIVYELLLRVIIQQGIDPRLLRNYINQSFILKVTNYLFCIFFVSLRNLVFDLCLVVNKVDKIS